MELAIYKVFRDAGIDEDKAQAIATTIWKAQEQSVDSRQLAMKAEISQQFATKTEISQQFATKADIEQHYAVHSQDLAKQGDVEKVRLDVEKLRLEGERTRLETRADIEQLRLETRADIEKVRLETKADIEKAKNDTIRWTIGSMVALAALVMAIARYVLTTSGG